MHFEGMLDTSALLRPIPAARSYVPNRISRGLILPLAHNKLFRHDFTLVLVLAGLDVGQLEMLNALEDIHILDDVHQ